MMIASFLLTETTKGLEMAVIITYAVPIIARFHLATGAFLTELSCRDKRQLVKSFRCRHSRSRITPVGIQVVGTCVVSSGQLENILLTRGSHD